MRRSSGAMNTSSSDGAERVQVKRRIAAERREAASRASRSWPATCSAGPNGAAVPTPGLAPSVGCELGKSLAIDNEGRRAVLGITSGRLCRWASSGPLRI